MRTSTETLRALVARVTQEVGVACGMQEDLMQEALIHLWWKESVRPGQSASWYLKSCHFKLLDCLRRGRSLDASKRGHLACELSNDSDADDCACNHPMVEETARSAAVAHDILAHLSPFLTRKQQKILTLLAQGYSTVEVAWSVGTSQPDVSKERRKIAATALRHGISPL